MLRVESRHFKQCLLQLYSAGNSTGQHVWVLMQDTARINAGRTPHAFFAKRAVQVDTGAAKVKLVTELTEPPLPPIHITQVSVLPSQQIAHVMSIYQPDFSRCRGADSPHLWGMLQANPAAVIHRTPETATFRLEAASASAAEDSSTANVSLRLCSPPGAASPASPAAPAAATPQGSRPFLQELAQQLADAERPSHGGGHEVRCTLTTHFGSATCSGPPTSFQADTC
jgi:hypothetical protein